MSTRLSEKEAATFDLVAIGLTDREIAVATGYSESAVKSQVRRILYKLGAVSRTHAVYLGFRRNILNRTRTITVPEPVATQRRQARDAQEASAP